MTVSDTTADWAALAEFLAKPSDGVAEWWVQDEAPVEQCGRCTGAMPFGNVVVSTAFPGKLNSKVPPLFRHSGAR